MHCVLGCKLQSNFSQTSIFDRVASAILEALRCFKDLPIEDLSEEFNLESRRTGSERGFADDSGCRFGI